MCVWGWTLLVMICRTNDPRTREDHGSGASPAVSDEGGNTWDQELRWPAWNNNTEAFINNHTDSHQTPKPSLISTQWHEERGDARNRRAPGYCSSQLDPYWLQNSNTTAQTQYIRFTPATSALIQSAAAAELTRTRAVARIRAERERRPPRHGSERSSASSIDFHSQLFTDGHIN